MSRRNSASIMRVSKRTLKRHQDLWQQTSAEVAEILNQGEKPREFYKRTSAQFTNLGFLSKSQRGINVAGGINLQELYRDIMYQIVYVSENWCAKARSYMVRNHPWHNQTGNAEAGLGASVAGMVTDRIDMYLYHSVPYGHFLEGYYDNDLSSWGFTYPRAGLLHIIQPTIDTLGPELGESLQHIME